jgi:hypothetical protein
MGDDADFPPVILLRGIARGVSPSGVSPTSSYLSVESSEGKGRCHDLLEAHEAPSSAPPSSSTEAPSSAPPPSSREQARYGRRCRGNVARAAPAIAVRPPLPPARSLRAVHCPLLLPPARGHRHRHCRQNLVLTNERRRPSSRSYPRRWLRP